MTNDGPNWKQRQLELEIFHAFLKKKLICRLINHRKSHENWNHTKRVELASARRSGSNSKKLLLPLQISTRLKNDRMLAALMDGRRSTATKCVRRKKAWMKQLFEQIKRKRFFHWISDDFQYCISKSRLMRQDRVRRRFWRFQSDGWKKKREAGAGGKSQKKRGREGKTKSSSAQAWHLTANWKFSVVIELRESFKVK